MSINMRTKSEQKKSEHKKSEHKVNEHTDVVPIF
jgi:hypothetical protein